MFSQSFTCNPASFSSAEISCWRTCLQQEGYLFLRGLLPQSDVLQARQCILDRLLERNLIHPLPQQSCAGECLPALAVDPVVSPNILSDLELQSKPCVAAVLEHPRIIEWLQKMWSVQKDAVSASGEKTTSQPPQIWTSQYKWLRAVPKGQCTGFHLDRVYMNGQRHAGTFKAAGLQERVLNRFCFIFFPGSTPLYSLWLPLGDLTPSHGNLVLSPRSHTSAAFASLREGYGNAGGGRKGDGTTSGWVKVEEWTEEEVEVSGL